MVSEQVEVRNVGQDVLEEVSEYIAEHAPLASIEQGLRDPSIPEGAMLGEATTDVGGVQDTKRIFKPASLVRAGDTQLPERTPVYRRSDNEISRVPTAQLTQQLSKVGADGQRIYSLRPWPGVEQKVPIDKKCRFCNRNFYSPAQIPRHERVVHTDLYNTAEMERQLEREERQDRTQSELYQGIMRLLERGMGPQEIMAEITAAESTTDTVEQAEDVPPPPPPQVEDPPLPRSAPNLITCPDCGKGELKGPKGLAFHKRRWCKGGST